MRRFRDSRGFSLVEILVVMTILGVVSAVVAGTVQHRRAQADQASARMIGYDLSNDVTSIVSNYMTLGSTAAADSHSFITLTAPVNGTATLTVNPGVDASVIRASGTTSTVRVADSTAIASSGHGANSTHWCMAVTSNGQSAVFTAAGLNKSAHGCAANGDPL